MNSPTKPERVPENERAFAAYVYEVGVATGVPEEAINYDFSDTVGAYLALGRRCAGHPDRDLALLWAPGQGWTLAVETEPGERAVVLARCGGEPMPRPAAVARFVAEELDGVVPDGA